MNGMTIGEMLRACRGEWQGTEESLTKAPSSIVTDSRQAGEGSLFLALRGEKTDGHKYIPDVLQKGALAVLCEERGAAGEPRIVVPDTLAAMQQIAAYYRNKMSLPIIGVTGSVGKTTTREMIAHVLKGKYKVFETIGNQNSQVGVPLTLDHLTSEDEIGVLEMGMSEKGQITTLGNIIHPNVGVVTNVGVSHIEMMGSRDNICIEKLDIQNGLPEDGVLFLNGDNDMIRKHIDYVKKPYEFYGFADDCTYRAEKIREKGGQTLFEFHYGDMKETITLNVLGKHNVSNALAAIAIGLRYDVPMDAIKAQLSTFSGQRQNIIHVNDYILIDDAYNASPDSMKASLSILSEFKTRGRKIAVLSDMLELGPDSPEYHKEVGRFIATTKVTDLFITGELSRHYIEEAWKKNPSLHTRAFSSNGELIAFLETYLKKNDVVLIKGSNGMNLKEVSKALMA